MRLNRSSMALAMAGAILLSAPAIADDAAPQVVSIDVAGNQVHASPAIPPAMLGLYRYERQGEPVIAAAFHEFFRHTDFIAMAGYTMATAWLNFDRTRSQISIKGRMFQFYQERFGTVPVAVDGNSPTPAPKYPVGGDQPSVNTGGPTYPLDVSAALTADGRTLAVAVVNATEEPHSFSLALQGFRPRAAGRCWKFTGPGPDAKNPLGEPERVGATESAFDASAGSLSIAPASVEIYHFERA